MLYNYNNYMMVLKTMTVYKACIKHASFDEIGGKVSCVLFSISLIIIVEVNAHALIKITFEK